MKRKGWKAAAPMFAALGDGTRLGVVGRLCEEGPLSIARLTDGAEVSRQAITKHLRVLEEAGLVKRSGEGRDSVWQLQPRRLAEARKHLDAIAKGWESAIERAKA